MPKVTFKEWKILEDPESGWCEIYRNDAFQSRTINMEEAKRYIWLKLKDTSDAVEYLSEDMMSA